MNTDIAVLESEISIKNVSEENIEIRRKLVREFEKMPSSFFTHIRHLQPQVGCLNRCSFCSQSAGTSIWYLNEVGLTNLFSALKTVAIKVAKKHKKINGEDYLPNKNIITTEGVFSKEFQMPKTGLLGYGRNNHRPGVLFCYLDNDISSYPFLDLYLKYAYEDFGVKIRISTVGYSRLNTHLDKMHKKINANYLDSLAGVRLSITPYTYGWTEHGELAGLTSREEFTKDISNFLETYRPAINKLGTGQRTGCVEFRFKPLIETRLPFYESFIDGHHVFSIGPYALVSKKKDLELTTSIVKVSSKKEMIIEGASERYLMLQSDEIRNMEKDVFYTLITNSLNGHQTDSLVKYSEVNVYRLENEDGYYYSIDPLMTEQGVYAKQFYPSSSKRKFAGYIDSERYFLNALLGHKRKRGINERRGRFENALWADTKIVIDDLQSLSDRMNSIDSYCSSYIKREILPMVSAYRQALENVCYPPSYFFDSTFTIDTGSICNLGQAFYEFKDIASRPHLPLTPQHERAYGLNSSLRIEGKVWRMSVTPTVKGIESNRTKLIGKRNVGTENPSLLIEEQDLERQSLSSPEGPIVQRFQVEFGGMEKTGLKEGMDEYFMIGQVKKSLPPSLEKIEYANC